MIEHALHLVIRRGVWRWQGAIPRPPMVLAFFSSFFSRLSAQSRTVMMIIPLPHYGNNFATKNFGRGKMCQSPPPPPPPRLSVVSRAGAMLSEIFCQDCGSVVSITYIPGVVCYGNGSGVAGCSW